jgi:cytochrome c biogenesis protein CcdA
VFGLDDRIAGLGGGSLAVALIAAVLLGLRHASDPDHLTAMSTLVLSDERRGGRRAAILGLAWGLGHATTLFLFGLPVVLFGSLLPDVVQAAAEAAIGAVIAALAVRLLVRWRRGCYHVHPHRHGDVRHAHPHVHEGARQDPHPEEHAHAHADGLGRTPLAAFGIGLAHGVGGSAGAGVLLVGALPGRAEAAGALVLFAAATALSMALVSAGFGQALTRGPMLARVTAAIPALGTLSLLFGLLYGLGALAALPA